MYDERHYSGRCSAVTFSFIMREDLLGYLLSALEPHEMRSIDQQLRDDPELRAELAELQRTLQCIDQSVDQEDLAELPPDLISRTLDAVSQCEATATSGFHSLASTPELVSGRERSLADLLVSALAAGALLALMFPTIARYRGEARKVACQNNLRQLGTALSQFVIREIDSYLPGIAESGPEAFSGMYAVQLSERGLLSDPALRLCPDMTNPIDQIVADQASAGPSSGEFVANKKFTDGDQSTVVGEAAFPASFADASDGPTNSHFVDNLAVSAPASQASPTGRLVTRRDLHAAAQRRDVALLRWLQRVAGGHYAYSLGVVDDSQYKPPKYENRASFALLGDAPVTGSHVTDRVDAGEMRWSHGEGANLLYEDGSVRYFHPSHMMSLPDHPYINHRGSIEAGVNIDDAALAPSWRPPFIGVRQR